MEPSEPQKVADTWSPHLNIKPIYLDALNEGQRIRVIKTFKDFDGTEIKEGSEWTFQRSSYFPYDGGHTFYFKEGEMRMAEISPEDYYVYKHFHEFFALMP
jgi:Domain of unknown function (DUF3601)